MIVSICTDQRPRQTSSASQVLPDGWRSWQNGAYATASQSRAGDSQSQPQPSTPFSPTEESRPAWDADKSFSTVRLGLTGMLRLMLAQCLSCLHLVTLQDEQLAWDGNAGKSMLEVGESLFVVSVRRHFHVLEHRRASCASMQQY